MILTTHAIIGAAVANMFPGEPHIGLSFSFISHYLIDALPHTNYKHEHLKNKGPKINFHNSDAQLEMLFIVLDVLMSVVLVFLLFVRDKRTFLLSVFGAFLGVLPDILNFFSYKIGGKFLVATKKIHNFFHYSKDYKHSNFHGMITQVAVVIFMVVVSILAISINS